MGLIWLLVTALLLAIPASASAVSRFVSPTVPILESGAASNLTAGNAAVTGTDENIPTTVTHAIALSVAGDHIVFKCGNGTMSDPVLYKGSSSMLNITSTSLHSVTARVESGCAGGSVLIDGEFVRVTGNLAGNNSWVIQDINFRNSNGPALTVRGSNNVVRRVVGWDSLWNWNFHVFQTTGSGSTNNLWEDVAGFGTGRKIWSPSQSSVNTTICRRCWFRWEGSVTEGPKSPLTMVYTSMNTTCENCLSTWSGESMPTSYFLTSNTNGLHCTNSSCVAGKTGTFTTVEQPGFLYHRDGSGPAGNAAKVYGSLGYIKAGDVWHTNENELLEQGKCTQTADIRHSIMFISPSNAAYSTARGFVLSPTGSCPGGVGPGVVTATRISSVAGTADSFGSLASVSGQVHVTAGSDAAALTALNNANANPYTGTTGAQLCFQWTPGGTTASTTPLWPWPMNDRILAATGYAGAYGAGYADATVGCDVTRANCSGGRAARTATDVSADVATLLGTPPAQCTTGGAITPDLSVSPATLTFDATVGQGNPPSQTFGITDVAGSGTMSWTVSDNASWLSVLPASGTDNGTVTVSIDTTGLTAGVYNGTVTVTATGATNSPRTVAVTLNMANPPIIPALSVSPTALNFTTSVNVNPTPGAISISDTNPGGAFTWTATDTASWLTVTPSSGSSDVVATVSINVSGLTPNIYLATITVSAPGSTGTPQTVDVSLTVLAGTSPGHRHGGRIR